LSGIGWQRQTQAAPEPPKDQKNEQPLKPDPPKKPEAPKAEDPADPLDQLFDLQMQGFGNLTPEMRDHMKKALEEARKHMQQLNRGGFGLGGPLQLNIPLGQGPNLNNPFGGAVDSTQSVRLGASLEKPSSVLTEQLDLPRDQGLVISEVVPGSAAAKGGIKPNDILLELNGKAVPSDMQKFRQQISEAKANTMIEAVVLRKGRKETIKGISLPEAKEEEAANPNPGLNVPNPFRAIPRMPNRVQLPVPQFPNINPPNFNVFPAAGNVESLSVSINNDQFTIDSNKNGIHITIGGQIDGDKAKVNSVLIQDGNEKTTVDRLDRVPEKFHEQVQNLLKRVEVQKK